MVFDILVGIPLIVVGLLVSNILDLFAYFQKLNRLVASLRQ